ncbi:MAG: SDR family oxidoreductase [Cyanobacteria bacterium J06632_22]
MKALVAGATGQTGRRIVSQLVERGISVRALVRNGAEAQKILPEAVELFEGDVLKPNSLRVAMNQCDVLLCATGASPSLDPTGPYQVDYEGTKHLIDAAKAADIKQFVLVSSLCVSRFFHPLNLFWLVLYWKQQAEKSLQNSGLPYTIVRPGGLSNDKAQYPIVMAPANTLFEGSILRDQVAQVCVEALFETASQNKIVEIVSQENAQTQPFGTLFEGVR